MAEDQIFTPECATSLCYIVMTMAIAELFRYLIRRTWDDPEGTPRVIFHELVCTFERTAIVIELVIIATVAGMFWFLFFLTLLCLWWGWMWEASKSSVGGHIQNLADGNITPMKVLIQVALETAFCVLVYPLYVRPLWQLMSHQQIRREKLIEVWSADIEMNQFPWQYACIIEFVGSFLLQLSGMVIAAIVEDGLVKTIIIQSISTAAVGLTLSSTGGYFNPVVSTAMHVGTRGISVIEHILTYWVCCIVGSLLAFVAFRAVAGDRDRKNR